MTTLNIEKSTRTGREGRSLTTSFDFPDTAQPTRYDGTEIARLDVTTLHDKDRKHYRTSVTRVTVAGNCTHWVMELRDEDPCPMTCYADPAPRFNAKKLEELHAEDVRRAERMMDELAEWTARVKRRDS